MSALANGQAIRTLNGAPVGVVSVAASANNASVAAGLGDGRVCLWNAADGKLLATTPAHSGAAAAIAFQPQSGQLLTGGGDGQVKLWGLPIAGSQRLEHPDAVTALAASGDGKRIYTGCADKVVRSWSVANAAQPERQFSGHPGPVTAVATNRDGSLLASAGDDGAIRFWDRSNGRQTATIGAHAGAVNSLSFHPDGNRVLSCSVDGSLKIWNAKPDEPKFFAHPDQVTCAVLTSDGSKLVTGCVDKQVRLWNLERGQVERAFPGNTLAVLSVATAGNLIAAGGADKSLFVWNASDGKEVRKFSGLAAAVRSVALSADGKLAAAGLADNSVRLFDLAMGKEVKSLAGHTGAVNALLFTATGDRVISASADKSIQVWNVVDGMVKLRIDAAAPVNSLALSKDGARVAAGCADKAVRLWTIADGKAVAPPITTPAEVASVAFSPDGTRLVAAGQDGKARIYGAAGELQEFFIHDGPVAAAAFLPDGKRILTASADKSSRMWSTNLVWSVATAAPVRQAAFNAKGDQVLSAGDDKRLSIWNAADGKPVKSFSVGDGAITSIAASLDGTRVACAGADRTLKIFPSGSEDKPVVVPLPAAASAVTFSPNGSRVAVALTGAKAGQTIVFETASGRLLQTLADHSGAIAGLAFLDDNRTLVSAGADKVVRLTDVAVLAAFDGHEGGVNSVAFHADGKQIISGGNDRFVRIRDLSTGKVTRSFGPLDDAVTAVNWSKDGSLVVAASGKSARIWKTADGSEVATLAHTAVVTGVSLSADNHRLATASADHIRIWDVASRQVLQSFAHEGPVTAVAFHSNNTNVVSASADKTVVVHTLQNVRTILSPSKVTHSLVVTPDGQHLLLAGDDGKIAIINVANGNVERSIEVGSRFDSLAISKQGTLLAAAGGEEVQVFSFSDGKRLARLRVPGGPGRIAFSPDGNVLAAASRGKTLETWNVAIAAGQPPSDEFGKAVASLAHPAAVSDLSWSSDGATVWTAADDKIVRAWRFPSDKPLKNFPHPNLVDAVAFSPDGKTLATGCHDGHVRLFDVAKGSQARDIKAHATATLEAIYCLAWSPDGKQIVSAGLDHSLKLWDAANGNLVKEFKAYKEKDFEKGHRDAVFCVAISPDGKTMASGSSDRSLKLWKVADGSVIAELTNPAFKPGPLPGPPQAHPGWIYGVRFTPDGKLLVSAGGAPQNRGYLAVWSLPDGKLLAGQEFTGGTIFGLAIAPDGKSLALGTAGRLPGQEPNVSYVANVPSGAK
jgi:WD40 repeat protein